MQISKSKRKLSHFFFLLKINKLFLIPENGILLMLMSELKIMEIFREMGVAKMKFTAFEFKRKFF